MVKCQQASCEENGYLYEYEGKKFVFCPYHKEKVREALRIQRGIGASNNGSSSSDYQDCDYCRGCYDEQGRYCPGRGKVFGRFNSRTQECDCFFCDYYPHSCAGQNCRNIVR